ncbi:MAG: DUF3795 domain-containing protein [Bacillota bacterium]|nr:DUF3795 domain-containing protein [Bacillota bacterium]
MKEILTVCGYRCDLCPAYKENIKNDQDKIRVSENWERLFGFRIQPDEVECVGCPNKGKLADANCPVRPCANEKGYDSCSRCDSYICDKLKTRTEFIAEYTHDLDNISREDYDKYIKAFENKPRLLELRKGNGR